MKFGFWLIRLAAKIALFGLAILLILNPNLKRVFLQVDHWRNPEALIEPGHPGLAAVNREIDLRWAAKPNRSELRVIEEFVQERVEYATDYEVWGNVEYWPTVTEVLKKGREDCDGRAVLAASIMRSRGYSSARLVVGLDHMWVQVNRNEKGGGAEKVRGLLQPEREVQVPLRSDPGLSKYLGLFRALANPTAIREAGSQVVFQVPPVRRALIVCVLLLLALHPNWRLREIAMALVLGSLSGSCFGRSLWGMDWLGSSVGWCLVLLGLVLGVYWSRTTGGARGNGTGRHSFV